MERTSSKNLRTNEKITIGELDSPFIVFKVVNNINVQVFKGIKNMEDMNTTDNAIQQLYDNSGMLDILLAVEKYFDDNDLYAYTGVIEGELVEGPNVTKYWCTVTFKYYRENFPDPTAFTVLEKHGTKVQVKADYEIRPIAKPRSRNDMKTQATQHGSVNVPRTERVPVLLVRFQIPRNLINPESFDEYKLMASEFNSNPMNLDQNTPDMSMEDEQDVQELDAEFGAPDEQKGGM